MKSRCKYCKKEFYKNRKDKIFCSKACKVKNKNNKRDRPYLIHKKERCENCGFVPIHECQLDVDHTDGNHNNNEPDNLRTLCANCHRLKTYVNKDWE